MNKMIEDHEVFVREALKDPSTHFLWLLEYHKAWIGFLQHERFIHLMVTLMVTFLVLVFFGCSLYFNTFPFLLVFLILTILLVFYVLHYYKLENSVQRWYRLYDEIVKTNEAL